MNILIGIVIVIVLVIAIAYLYRPEKVGVKVDLVSAELRGDKWAIVVDTKKGLQEYEGNTLGACFEKAHRENR